MQVRLTTPLTRQELAPLHAGDTVLLTGTVYTARDAAHARMNEALDRGEPLPFDIKGAAIYYVGPTPGAPRAVPLVRRVPRHPAAWISLPRACWTWALPV